MPLQVNGRVVIVRHIFLTRTIKPGDWIAYNLSDSNNTYYVRVDSGIAMGPVLAMPGDKVEFSATTLSVNGVSQPRLPNMPITGTFVVPEKRWFIWPDLARHGHGDVSEASISDKLLQLAMVKEEQLIGRPFQRWFWRRQILS